MTGTAILGFTVAVFATSCSNTLEQTSASDASELSGNLRTGSPPLCFQQRKEARNAGNFYRLWLHMNNTCGYLVQCSIWDDVNDAESKVAVRAHEPFSLLVSPESETNRFEVELDCEWEN